MKKKKNVCFIMIPIVIVLALICVAIEATVLINDYKNDNTVSLAEKYPNAEHDTLWSVDVVFDEDEGKYYYVSGVGSTSYYSDRVIAFVTDEEIEDPIEYGAGSYYPECYWEGKYEIVDLSEELLSDVNLDGDDEGMAHLSDVYSNIEAYSIDSYLGYDRDPRSAIIDGGVYVFLFAVVVGITLFAGAVICTILGIIGAIIEKKRS